MSTRALTGWELRRRALGAVPVLTAGCAAALSVLLARRFPAPLVAAAVVGGCLLLFIRADPIRVLLALAVLRAGIEVWQDRTIVRLFGVQLSPPDVITIAFLVGSVWWLVNRARAGVPVWKAPTFFPALLLLTIIATSLLYSSAPAIGARDLVKFAAAYAVYLVIVTARPDVHRLKALLALVVAGAAIPIAVGFWQFSRSVGRGGLRPAGLRIQATFDHPNTYGFFLVSIVAVAWGIRKEVPSRFRPFVDIIGIAALVSAALTLSRNTWGALAVLAIVIGWRDRRVFVTAAVCAGIAVLAMPRLITRALEFLHPQLGSSNTGNSLLGRLDLWTRDLALWRTQPILGRGWGSLQAQVTIAAHNDFIRALAEAGIVGFVAYLLLIGALNRMGIRSGSSRHDLPRAFMGLALAYTLVSLASNNSGKGAFQFYFWLIAGVSYVWSQTVPDGRAAHLKILKEVPP